MNDRRNISLGVGDGTGHLFVNGDHASINACQQKLLELERMRAENEALRAALEGLVQVHRERFGLDGAYDTEIRVAEAALAAHDKEGK